MVATAAPWIQAAHEGDGTAQARGRWFTRIPLALAFYLDDTPQPELVTLDLPEAEAWACGLKQLPAVLPDGCRPRSFSRDPEIEHFVPGSFLAGTQCWSLEMDAAAPRPRVRRRPA